MDEHRTRRNDSSSYNQLGKEKQVKPNFLTIYNCNDISLKRWLTISMYLIRLNNGSRAYITENQDIAFSASQPSSCSESPVGFSLLYVSVFLQKKNKMT